MSTPIRKEFGPGYDYPNRKFHFWAVIFPTVLIIALAVVLMRHMGAPSSRILRNPVVACPKQTCPPPGSADSAKATQTAKAASTSTAGLGASQATVRDLSPSKKGPSPGSPARLSATPGLSATGAMLSRSSSAVTHAVILSSA
jgi:hypothetical protein